MSTIARTLTARAQLVRDVGVAPVFLIAGGCVLLACEAVLVIRHFWG